MKKLASLLLFFVSAVCFAGPVGGAPVVPSLTVGNRVYTDLSNLVILTAISNGANRYSTFFTPSGVAYTPSAGKKLRVFSIKVINASPSVVYQPSLGYSDNSVGIQSSSAGTNPVFMYGGVTQGAFQTSAGVGVSAEIPVQFDIPNAKYPYLDENSTSQSGQVIIFGYEQ